MSIVLENLVEASERSADQLGEKLILDSDCALLAFDIRDLARQAVSLLHTINIDVSEWQLKSSDSANSARKELAAVAEGWDSLYRRLANVFDKTAHLIKSVEAIGPSVDGKAAFFHAWRSLRVTLSFSRESVAESMRQSQRNEVRSLEEVKRALFGSVND